MSNYTIRTGVWVHHNAAPALGATLTVPIRWGNYLIAALSSLVAWAGSRAWSLLCFYAHQRLAAKPRRDLLDQQLQVHLRAGGSFFDAWLDGIGLQRAWTGRSGRVKRRTLPLVVCSSAFFLAFAAAGVFVADVATKSYQDVLVLATPNDCGDFLFQDGEAHHNEYLDVLTRYQNEIEVEARNYARDLYYGARSRDSVYPQPALPFAGRYVPCPYAHGTTCLGPNATRDAPAWNVDSGLLDSYRHLGINAPARDRVLFRESATCAVVDPANLTTAPYWRVESYNGHRVNMTYLGILQQFAPDRGGDSNLVFEVSANLIFERSGFFSQRGIIMGGETDPGKSLTGPPFRDEEADVVLITTSQSRMFYYGPVDDPYYLAHSAATGDEYAHDLDATVYYATHPFALMACTDRAQLCNPSNGRCSPLSGNYRIRDAVRNNTLAFNRAQMATALRLVGSRKYVAGLISNVAHGTTGLLVAEQNGVRGGSSVPADQWTKEVDLWFASGLAALQSSLLQWIAKPWPRGRPEPLYPLVNLGALGAEYDARSLGRERDALCRNQLIRSSAAVQNFSVLALAIVVFASLAIIVTALALPPCVDRSRAAAAAARRRDGDGESGREASSRPSRAAAEAGRIARLADDKYGLLAMALQGAGLEGWVRGRSGIPVTTSAVAVQPPREKDGVAAYPMTTAACQACQGAEITTAARGGAHRSSGSVPSDEKRLGSTKTEEVGECEQEKQGETWEKEDDEYDGPATDKLRKRNTEETLVSSPVRSGSFQVPVAGLGEKEG